MIEPHRDSQSFPMAMTAFSLLDKMVRREEVGLAVCSQILDVFRCTVAASRLNTYVLVLE